MLLVALTGGIAAGKSVVAQIFEQLGCYIHESDNLAHQLIEPEKPAWKAIVDHFGRRILNLDKTINRSILGRIVFNNSEERRYLDDLLHPLVIKKKKDLVRRIRNRGRHKIFVSVAALTFEAGFADYFDKIVVVYCDKKTQMKRLMERDNITREEALNKIRSQMRPEEKLKSSDYIIDTSGTLQQTVEQAEKVFRNLMVDYELKASSKVNS
jgi:dephospho-CoA kinase